MGCYFLLWGIFLTQALNLGLLHCRQILYTKLQGKSWLTGKDLDAAGKVWRQEEKGMTEDEMVGWHHQLNGHEFEQAQGDGEGQWNLGALAHRVTNSLTKLSDWTRLGHTHCLYFKIFSQSYRVWFENKEKQKSIFSGNSLNFHINLGNMDTFKYFEVLLFSKIIYISLKIFIISLIKDNNYFLKFTCRYVIFLLIV